MFGKIGENVEPSEIEEAAMRSSLVHQILVIGQVKLIILLIWVFNSIFPFTVLMNHTSTLEVMHNFSSIFVIGTITCRTNVVLEL